MQRLMSYSRQGRPRSPVITSLQERIPNRRCVSAIVRRPSDAGRNGPGVVVVVALDAAGDEDARERLAGRQLEIGVVLVVAEEDVVAWRARLDQVVLERQRLHDRVGDNEGEPLGIVEQGVDARTDTVGAEIAADAVAQDPGLADVKRVAGGVLEE